MSKIFLIKKGNQTIGFNKNNNNYVIGFQNLYLTRKIQYSIHPEPQFTIINSNKIYDKQTNLSIDTELVLFIPKYKGSFSDPLNDGCYHLSNMSYNDFLLIPTQSYLNIIMPYKVITEDQDEYTLKCIGINNLDLEI